MSKKIVANKTYTSLLQKIVQEIGATKVTVARVINTELIQLYRTIGKMISEKQRQQGWGESVIEKLATDIAKRTGHAQGFSPRNLWLMKQFYEEYQTPQFLQQLVAELKLQQAVAVLKPAQVLGLVPWGHHLLLMQKTPKNEERIYYLTQAIINGWSRNVLLNQVKAGLSHYF
jgi:predicted nuclease of restriction endonuclease-like (RecB) superfamily